MCLRYSRNIAGNMYSDIWVLEYALHFFMGAVGLFVGMNVDREGNTWQNIKDCIPRDIHRLR